MNLLTIGVASTTKIGGDNELWFWSCALESNKLRCVRGGDMGTILDLNKLTSMSVVLSSEWIYILFFLSWLGSEPGLLNEMKRNVAVAMCLQWFKFFITLLFVLHHSSSFKLVVCIRHFSLINKIEGPNPNLLPSKRCVWKMWIWTSYHLSSWK